MKRVQLFINKHYESIKLVLLLITVSLAAATMLLIIENNAQEAKNRYRHTEDVIKELKSSVTSLQDDNARQTRLISCLLIIHGQNVTISQQDQLTCEQAIQQAEIFVTPPKASPSVSAPEAPKTSQTPTQNERNVVEMTVDGARIFTDWAIKTVREPIDYLLGR